MEPGDSMPHSQGLLNNPYSEPYLQIPRICIHFLQGGEWGI